MTEGSLNGKSVAFVRHNVLDRGSDIVADHFASRLAEAGARITIYHCRDGFDPSFEPQHRHYAALVARSRAAYLAELATMRFRQADYVLTDFAPLLWCLGLRNRNRLVYLAQSDDCTLYESRWARELLRRLLRICLTKWRVPALCTSQHLAHTLRMEYQSDVTLISEGEWFRLLPFTKLPPTRQRLPRCRPQVILSIVARPHAKGGDVCFDTLRCLEKELADQVEVWLVGRDEQWCFDDLKVRHWGQVSQQQLAGLYSNADAFLFCSRCENFPSPPFEAMARGCPVVSTWCGGYLRPNDNCLLAGVSDPKDIASAIKELLSSERLKKRLIGGGRRAVLQALARYGNLTTFAADFNRAVQRLRCSGVLKASARRHLGHLPERS